MVTGFVLFCLFVLMIMIGQSEIFATGPILPQRVVTHYKFSAKQKNAIPKKALRRKIKDPDFGICGNVEPHDQWVTAKYKVTCPKCHRLMSA